MTEATEAVEACIEVPAQGKVEMNFTLEPTGADQKWILKDDNGDEWDTICVKFDGVKSGGVGKSGKAELTIQMVNSDLVFKKLAGNVDGINIYDVVNDGDEGISSCKVDSQNAQQLKMVLKANKQTENAFSFKWVAEDTSGNEVLSADPRTVLEPQ
ncbi:hypothetical protein JF535_05265 [Microbulbifer salipaludis]|uniref:PLAT domain-containing protein n=1 Tax=Microbulbifer salipaludis TaxID=187980 RepID=A0ABS3E4M8_9GAMM|nr:hypothetical protein [Microbulbifer salipaludis]MBN8430261.1 hypothetical protein [Microbulbifer salipaludis]